MKVTKAYQRVLKEDYERVCNAYLVALLDFYEMDAKYGFWVAGDVGGVFSLRDTGFFIEMKDIIYVVHNGISYSEYMEWLEYCVWAAEFGQTTPNLEAWHNGCPRVDSATQEKMSAMRRELNELIEETRNKF